MDIDETRFEANAPFVLDHVELLRSSYKHWTGKDLLPPEMHAIDAQGALFDAPFAVLSHGPEPDPVFFFGFCLVLFLFVLVWVVFVFLFLCFFLVFVVWVVCLWLLVLVCCCGFV